MQINYKEKLFELFENDTILTKSLETGIKKGESVLNLFDRAIRRGSRKGPLNDLIQMFSDEFETSKFQLDYDKNIAFFKTLTSLDTQEFNDKIKIYTGDDSELIFLCLKQYNKFLDESEISTSEDIEEDKSYASEVPFISPEILMVDKTEVINEINFQMLDIANIVLETELCGIDSFAEYEKDVFNEIFGDLKKRHRYQLAGKAEMLRWHISLYDMRVENIGHKMLSYIIEQCQD